MAAAQQNKRSYEKVEKGSERKQHLLPSTAHRDKAEGRDWSHRVKYIQSRRCIYLMWEEEHLYFHLWKNCDTTQERRRTNVKVSLNEVKGSTRKRQRKTELNVKCDLTCDDSDTWIEFTEQRKKSKKRGRSFAERTDVSSTKVRKTKPTVRHARRWQCHVHQNVFKTHTRAYFTVM